MEAGAITTIVLGAATAYCWDIDVEHWGNAYYSAIAQTGALSWKSFFFGSLEAGNAVSSDKPPGAFWVMALSVRTFGLSSWSVMLPQGLETAATILILYRTVRRLAGPLAGVVAALVLATTPVVLVLARNNLPDTLMTLLVVAAAYCCVRALDGTGWRWLAATGAFLGLAFLTKWAASLLPAPGFAAALVGTRRIPMAARLRRISVVALAAAVAGLACVTAVLAIPPAPDRTPTPARATSYTSSSPATVSAGSAQVPLALFLGTSSRAPPALCGSSSHPSAGRSHGCFLWDWP